uniref:RRM domain-containing protein n=1 Tax=Parastrongyloides trichosuri TaxID=131310 RepID=A0A0N4ZY41_PARTI
MPSNTVLRLSNVPFSAKASDIRGLFEGITIPIGFIIIVGGPSNDVFVKFSSDEDAEKAKNMNFSIHGTTVSKEVTDVRTMSTIVNFVKDMALKVEQGKSSISSNGIIENQEKRNGAPVKRKTLFSDEGAPPPKKSSPLRELISKYIEMTRLPNDIIKREDLITFLGTSDSLKMCDIKIVFDSITGIHLNTLVKCTSMEDFEKIMSKDGENGIRVKECNEETFITAEDDSYDQYLPQQPKELVIGAKKVLQELPPMNNINNSTQQQVTSQDDGDVNRVFVEITNVPFRVTVKELQGLCKRVRIFYRELYRCYNADDRPSDRWLMEFVDEKDADKLTTLREVIGGREVIIRKISNIEAEEYLSIPPPPDAYPRKNPFPPRPVKVIEEQSQPLIKDPPPQHDQRYDDRGKCENGRYSPRRNDLRYDDQRGRDTKPTRQPLLGDRKEPPKRYDKDDYGKDTYMKDNYLKDNYGKDNYCKDNYGKDNYSKDNYGKDNYIKDNYGKDNYGKDNYNKDNYSKDNYNKDNNGYRERDRSYGRDDYNNRRIDSGNNRPQRDYSTDRNYTSSSSRRLPEERGSSSSSNYSNHNTTHRPGTNKEAYIPKLNTTTPEELDIDISILNAIGNNGCVVITKGMPTTITLDSVVDFFKGYPVKRETALMKLDDDARPTGECLLAFTEPEYAKEAVLHLNGKRMDRQTISVALIKY